MSEVRPRDRAALLFAALAVLAAGVRLIALTFLRPLNWDELEFFRATDWVRQGLLPYRDFWEHHTPLQWYLFAPVTAFAPVSGGVKTILLMRWAQVPLWIASICMLMMWMRDAGIERTARRAALVLVLTTSMFMLPASEYRIDAVACVLYILGLLLMQRMERGAGYAFAAGVAFCLSAFANLRVAPLLAVTVLLTLAIRFPERKWRWNGRAMWIIAGGSVMLAAAVLYFAAAGTLGLAFRSTVRDNYVADKYSAPVPLMFLHRLIAPFGLRLIDADAHLDWTGIDPAAMALLVLGTIGIVRVLRRNYRNPDELFFIAVVALANVYFTSSMTFIFNYHFLIAILILAPFVAIELARMNVKGVAALLIVTSLANVAVALFRGKEDDLAYQNLIMHEVDRRTPPGSKVWDGSGWALHRPSAYRYWFLREIVFVLVQRGYFTPYTPAAMAADPPAAVVADYDVRLWMGLRPDLGHFVAAHYLPIWPDFWEPGMSARLSRNAPSFTWTVPADGTYAVYASPRLAGHHWFVQPLYFDTRIWRTPALVRVTEADRMPLRAPLRWTLDGVPVTINGASIALRRGQKLGVSGFAGPPVGIMLVRGDVSELFREPPRGVTLEASAPPEWHVPRFRWLP